MSKQLLLLGLFFIGIQPIGFSQVDDSTYQKIDEVIISAEQNKEIIFEDSKYYIVDFVVSETNTLLLMKSFGKYFIYELDEDMQLRDKFRLKMDADFLYEDCFGNTHIVAKDSVYSIMSDSLGLFFTDVHPKREFMNSMSKCVGSTFEKIIFEKRTHYNQNQKFYTVDIDSGHKKVIYQINDSTINRGLTDAEVLIQTDEYYSNHQRMGDINGNKEMSFLMRRLNENHDRGDFFYSHVTRPKYNPMFVMDDTLYFFNHSEGKIDQLDDRGTIVSTSQIDYHQKEGWQNMVYSDKAKKKFYALRIDKGIQNLIALSFNNDEQEYSTEITQHAYPKKVIVLDGYAYYTYKPNFDANLNKLYRQRL